MKVGLVQTIVLAAGLSLVPRVQAKAAEEPEAPRSMAVRAARLIDVRAGEVIHDAVVIIDGDRVRSVGTGLAVPSDARLIDLGDVTLLPGLVDAHTHLLHQYYFENGGDEANRILELVQMGTARRALLGARLARQALAAGFTTVRDVGNSGVNGDVALRDAINAGWVNGPRVFACTRALSPVGGQFQSLTPAAQELIEQEYAQVSGIEDARRAVRQAVYDGADCIKVIVDVGPRRVLSLEEMQVIVEEAHRAGLPVAAHVAGSDAAALISVEAGVNSIEHGYTLSAEVLEQMAKKKIFLVPTDAPGVDAYQARIQRAVNAGVRIAIGSDLYYDFVPGLTRGQMAAGTYKNYIDSGMSTIDVLRSATIHPADLLDSTHSIGAIEAGRMADIIAVRGDLFEDIYNLGNVEFVMKGGQVFKDNIGTSAAR